jgi:hypothetical protein
MKRLIGILITAFVIMSLLTSCCTSQKVGKRRIARIVNCNPSLINDLRDTVTIRITDTIVTQPVSGSFTDTLTANDTLTHVTPNGIVTRVVVTLHDTIKRRFPIYIETECPPDTIFVDITRVVPCPDPIVVADVDPARERVMKIQWFGFGAGIGSLFILLLIWGLGKLRG